MSSEDCGKPSGFGKLSTKKVPHIYEKIFFSLDYESYKTCLEVSKTWSKLLTSESFQGKGKSVFRHEILADEANLSMALQRENKNEVERLLSSGMLDVNRKYWNKYGEERAPLLEAAMRGHLDMVQFLLNGGADADNVLHVAACWGRKDVVQLLLNGGADANKANTKGQTSLLLSWDENVVQLLLEKGADPNKADEDGLTKLHRASCLGRKEKVQLLLAGGADPNKATPYGWTPLHEAEGNGHKDVVQLLLNGGATPLNCVAVKMWSIN